MARCIDCLHCEACSMMYEAAFGKLPRKTGDAGRCETFKHKDSVIVPPCKIGTPIYRVCGIKGNRQTPYVRKFKLTYKTLKSTIEDFGKTVFLTYEEAERVANEKRIDS